MLQKVAEQFSDEYYQLSSVRPVDSVQVVNCKLKAVGVVAKPKVSDVASLEGDVGRALKKQRKVCFDLADGFLDVPVYDRALLRPGDHLQGPAVIEEPESTTICRGAWQIRVDGMLNIVITRVHASGRDKEVPRDMVSAPVA